MLDALQIKKPLKRLIIKQLRGIIKWEHTGSNRGPSACKADALNQLSYAPNALRDCKGIFHFGLSKVIFKEIF
jgi:hypothetical protein